MSFLESEKEILNIRIARVSMIYLTPGALHKIQLDSTDPHPNSKPPSASCVFASALSVLPRFNRHCRSTAAAISSVKQLALTIANIAISLCPAAESRTPTPDCLDKVEGRETGHYKQNPVFSDSRLLRLWTWWRQGMPAEKYAHGT